MLALEGTDLTPRKLRVWASRRPSHVCAKGAMLVGERGEWCGAILLLGAALT